MVVLLGDIERIDVRYHVGQLLKRILVLVLILHLIAVCIVDTKLRNGRAVAMLIVVYGELSFCDIAEVVVLCHAVCAVLAHIVAVRQQPFQDFVLAIRQLIGNDALAVFVKLKGIVLALRVNLLCVRQEAVIDALDLGTAVAVAFLVLFIGIVRIALVSDKDFGSFERNVLSCFGIHLD